MAALKNKLQNALDEGRILLLGAQVFIGFHYRSVFDSGFAHLPSTSQYLRLGALGLMPAILGRGKTDEDEVENGHRQA